MEIISRTWRNDNRFGERYSSLDIETQLNIRTPTVSNNNFLAGRQFVSNQVRRAGKWRVRNATKKAMHEHLTKLGFTEYADNLARCCETFETVVYCQTENIVYQQYPKYRCGLPFCPDCANAKSVRELSDLLPKVITALNNDRNLRPALLTLTMPKDATRTYGGGCRQLKRFFRRLRKRAVMRDCAGGYFRIENTLTEYGFWHPHIHALILVDRSKSLSDLEEELRQSWYDLTGATQVDVQKVEQTSEGLVGVLLYPFKAADLTRASLSQFEEVLDMKGERFGEPFGVIYGLDADVDANEKPIDDYADFVEMTKKLKVGDACPSCGTTLVSRSFTRDELTKVFESAKIVGMKRQPHCRGH